MSWFLLGLSSFKADIEKWAQPGPAAGRSLFLSIFFLNLSRPAQLPPPLLLSLLCRAPKPSFSLLLLTYFKWKQEEGKLWKMVCAYKTLHNSSNFNGFICWLWLIRFAPFLWQITGNSLVSGSPWASRYEVKLEIICSDDKTSYLKQPRPWQEYLSC